MNTADDGTPNTNRQPDEPDLGPEPSWLLDDDELDAEEAGPTESAPPVEHDEEAAPGDQEIPAIEPSREQDGPGERTARETTTREITIAPAGPSDTTEEPSSRFTPLQETGQAGTAPGPDDVGAPLRAHPWLWGAVPFVLLLATGVIAWFGTTQSLNDVTTWEAIRRQGPPLLPARWAMTIWWLVLPLMGIFLIYGILPVGRTITRIKTTGLLVALALLGTSLWIFAQHWEWQVMALIGMGVAAASILASYLLVALGPAITNIRQRILAVLPFSAAMAYSLLLTVVSWQSYSAQPFGERGSSVLFALLLVMIAAVFAFFLRDGLFAAILAIWFAGVIHQQWGDDAIISLVAIVVLIFSVALAALGTILATESHRPSLTTPVATRRGRINFFRKQEDSSEKDLS